MFLLTGKINPVSAEEQAQFISESWRAQHRGGEEGTDLEEEGDMDGAPTFDLAFVASGHVRVETLSWIEAVRRKCGFTEGEGPAGGAHLRSPSTNLSLHAAGATGGSSRGTVAERNAAARARAEAVFAALGKMDDNDKRDMV